MENPDQAPGGEATAAEPKERLKRRERNTNTGNSGRTGSREKEFFRKSSTSEAYRPGIMSRAPGFIRNRLFDTSDFAPVLLKVVEAPIIPVLLQNIKE